MTDLGGNVSFGHLFDLAKGLRLLAYGALGDPKREILLEIAGTGVSGEG